MKKNINIKDIKTITDDRGFLRFCNEFDLSKITNCRKGIFWRVLRG